MSTPRRPLSERLMVALVVVLMLLFFWLMLFMAPYLGPG